MRIAQSRAVISLASCGIAMAINAFGGGPGSGKTYGVMEHVILIAVAQGRFILTNIEGLNPEEIYAYVAQNFYKGKIICIGHIRTCNRNAPEDGAFFPGEAALDKAMSVPSPELGQVNGGDLVVIDEATRYWPQGDKVKPSHAYFFREHRHFANEMGHTCDLVVIDPDLSLLARPLKGKIEMASVTHKPKEIGLNRYVVNIYRGYKLNVKPQQTLGPYAFKKEIYSLYKSYSHAKAREQAIDGRQNALKNPRLWLTMGGMALMCCVSGYYLWWFFKGRMKAPEPAKMAASSPATSAGIAPSTSNVSVSTKATADKLRIAGEITINGEHWVVVADQSGRMRLESPAAFVGRGVMLVGTVDGQRVATWTGGATVSNVPQVNQK